MSQTEPVTHTSQPSTQSTRTGGSAKQSFWRGRSELIMVALIFVIASVLLYGSLTMNVLGTESPGPEAIPLGLSIVLYAAAIIYAILVIRNPEVHEDVEREHQFSPDMLYDLAGMDESEDIHRHPLATAQIRVPVDEDGNPLDVDEHHTAAQASGGAGVGADLSTPTTDTASTKTEVKPRRDAVYSNHKTLLATVLTAFGFVLVLPYAGWVLSAAALFWFIARFLGSRRPVFDLAIGLIVSSVIQLIFSGLLSLNLPAGVFGGIS